MARPGDSDGIPERFTRVAVVGTSCSGKTTLSRRLVALLGAPHVELDALHWGPNWTPTPEAVFQARVEAALAPPRWVCDGNYGAVRALVWSRATAVVWLNYSFPRVFGQALRRTLRRVITQEALYADNRESLAGALLSRDSILLWVLSTYRERRRRYAELVRRPEHAHLHVVELRHPREADQLLQRLVSALPPDIVRRT